MRLTNRRRTSSADVKSDEYLAAMYALAYRRLHEVVEGASNGRAAPDRTVEIGSGLALAADSGQRWLHSDVRDTGALDIRHAAERLPYTDNSLDALVLKDTWHHIPDITAFIDEAHRVLRPGGVVAVFDPYWGLLARFVYRFLHQERWDARTTTWGFSSSDPRDSNQALSYLMLRRDRREFDRRFASKFAMAEHGALIGPSFLLSGGVSRRTSVSGSFLHRLLDWEERQGRWLDHLRFFHVFTLVKR